MEKKIKSTLIENYFDFKCTGPQCIDNCCYSWQIDIDEKSYNKYKNSNYDDVKFILDKITVVDNNIAKITLDDNGKCPHLNENLLCDIHKNLGESYLSITCNTYPRNIKKFNYVQQYSFSLSCPEVVKTYIFSNKELSFHSIESDKSDMIDKHNYKFAPSLSYDIRSLAINIINSTKYNIQSRLYFFAISLNGINNLIINKAPKQEILNKIYCYDKYFEDSNNLSEIVNNSNYLKNESIDLHISIFNYFINYINLNPKNKLYNLDFYDKFKNIENKEALNKILENKKRLVDTYIEQNPFVFSNYITYIIFSKSFTTNGLNFEHEINSILIRFNFIKTFISVLYFDKDKIEDKDIVNVIYYIYRVFDHRPNCEFIKFCEENKIKSSLCLSLI